MRRLWPYRNENMTLLMRLWRRAMVLNPFKNHVLLNVDDFQGRVRLVSVLTVYTIISHRPFRTSVRLALKTYLRPSVTFFFFSHSRERPQQPFDP